jgi:hypothetical protein
MHTVELLEEAVSLAKHLGMSVRHEWLGGSPAGACELKGKRWVFVDLSLPIPEQLDQVVDALRGTPIPPGLTPSRALQAMLELRRAA